MLVNNERLHEKDSLKLDDKKHWIPGWGIFALLDFESF